MRVGWYTGLSQILNVGGNASCSSRLLGAQGSLRLRSLRWIELSFRGMKVMCFSVVVCKYGCGQQRLIVYRNVRKSCAQVCTFS